MWHVVNLAPLQITHSRLGGLRAVGLQGSDPQNMGCNVTEVSSNRGAYQQKDYPAWLLFGSKEINLALKRFFFLNRAKDLSVATTN